MLLKKSIQLAKAVPMICLFFICLQSQVFAENSKEVLPYDNTKEIIQNENNKVNSADSDELNETNSDEYSDEELAKHDSEDYGNVSFGSSSFGLLPNP